MNSTKLWRRGNPSPLLFQLFALATSIVIIASIQTDFSYHRSPKSLVLVDGEGLSHRVFGFTMLVSDSLWIRALQDINLKDNMSKGWVYHMIDTITILDKRFKMAYYVGATILSILVQDTEGARLIYERGVANYPHEWSLIYRASYHYLFEVKECRRAAELFKQAVENGAPPWIAALSGRLFAKSGQYEMARSVIADAMGKLQDHTGYYLELKKRLDQLDQFNKDPNHELIQGLDCQAK